MPSEARILALRDDLVDTLRNVNRAEGYWYDYRGVSVETTADWETEKDYEVPLIHVAWDGEADPGDPRFGVEARQGSGANRFRRFDQFVVSLAFKEKEDPAKVAWRIHTDLHAAVMGQSNRHRSGTRVNTFDAGAEWYRIEDGGKPLGGILAVTFVIRWDHLSGDMSSQ